MERRQQELLQVESAGWARVLAAKVLEAATDQPSHRSGELASVVRPVREQGQVLEQQQRVLAIPLVV